LTRGQRLLDAIVRIEVLDVFHQVDQALFADLPLIGRHDRRIARGYAGRRVENRLAEKGIIGGDIRSVRQLQPGAVDLGQVGAARVASPEWQELQPRLAKRRSPFCASEAPLVLPAAHAW
jgi:hypothetical protein